MLHCGDPVLGIHCLDDRHSPSSTQDDEDLDGIEKQIVHVRCPVRLHWVPVEAAVASR